MFSHQLEVEIDEHRIVPVAFSQNSTSFGPNFSPEMELDVVFSNMRASGCTRMMVGDALSGRSTTSRFSDLIVDWMDDPAGEESGERRFSVSRPLDSESDTVIKPLDSSESPSVLLTM